MRKERKPYSQTLTESQRLAWNEYWDSLKPAFFDQVLAKWDDPEFQHLIPYIKNFSKLYKENKRTLDAQLLIGLASGTEAIGLLLLSPSQELRNLMIVPVIAVPVILLLKMLLHRSEDLVNNETGLLVTKLSALKLNIREFSEESEYKKMLVELAKFIEKVEHDKAQAMNQRIARGDVVVGDDGELVFDESEDTSYASRT